MVYTEGDFVRITTEDESLEGIILPRPEMLEGDFVVIKLDNGYNIGIDRKKVRKIELLKKGEAPKQEKRKIKQNPDLPKVSILSYGGTISSKVDYRTGGVYADLTAEDFVQMCPELENIANITARKELSMMSEDFDWKVWEKIAKDIATELNNGAEGVVITQGTDTLHYTASALSFFLKDLCKPVIITASQRSIDRGSSDAYINLICAVKAAANFDGAGVYSCLHGSSDDEYCFLIRGTKVRKMHTSRRDAFRPINELPIAKVYPYTKGIEIINNNYNKKKNGNVIADTKHEENISIVFVHPGMNPDVIDFHIKSGAKGIVLMATALGHVPTLNKENSLMPFLEQARKKNIPVLITTQTIYGRVHPLVYTNLRKLSIGAGAIFCEDMLAETAYVKLGWALGHANSIEKVKEMMLHNYAGEINSKIDKESFLL